MNCWVILRLRAMTHVRPVCFTLPYCCPCEAIYLADPEAIGIEVYVDHPVADWRGADGEIRMATDPLDLQALLRAAGDTQWAGFPEDGSIGHVHLQVGDTKAADRFYRDVLGFAVTATYPGASVYGSGGYHHQLAGNIWNSRRAGPRPDGVAGLEAVEIILGAAENLAQIAGRAEKAGVAITRDINSITLHDPWGIAITLNA